MSERFKSGDCIRHFKREEHPEGMNFLYIYIGNARHTETGELLAVYKALYGEQNLYARPLEMLNETMEDGRPRFEKATLEDLEAVKNAISSEMLERH